jgi:hypothetical protein
MACEVQRSERKEGPDERGSGVSGVREGREYPVGVKRYWAVGHFLARAGFGPRPLYYFFCSFYFSFLFFLFLSYNLHI